MRVRAGAAWIHRLCNRAGVPGCAGGYVAGGEIYICGRQKDLIISSGRNIFGGELPGR